MNVQNISSVKKNYYLFIFIYKSIQDEYQDCELKN